MYFVTDKGWAIALMVGSLWCLGTWPVFFHIAERRGRLPQHTFMDYSCSAFLVSLLFALTLGQMGDDSPASPNFIPQLQQDNIPCVLIAMAGGVALCLGNLFMQYSLVFAGISLTEVISASLAVIIGTTANYFLDNCLNSARILFPGVACFVVAVVLGSLCHASNAADIRLKLGKGERGVHASLLSNRSTSSQEKSEDVGSLSHFIRIEESRAVKVRGSAVVFGLTLPFVTGICYGFFSPLFNIATNDQFHWLKSGTPKLAVYTSFFYFSAAFFVVGVAVNACMLYWPPLGLPRSSVAAYARDWQGRHLAAAAGLLCGLGNGLQFMGGQAAGYAAADAVQALPLVGTLWGVALFGEYRRSSRRTYALLASMLAMFLLAVALLVASAAERP